MMERTPNEPGQPTPAAAPADVSLALDVPTVALAIGAHPDDVDFGCGATLAKWAADGCIVHHVVLTDGSKGTWDPLADTVELAARREDEQCEAARRLAGDNAGSVAFLRYVDGELEVTREATGRLARLIRELRPDVVLGHDPWKRYRLHPDHRHAGVRTCDAVVAARDPHFFREHDLPPHRPGALLLWEADTVNHVEDVSGFVDRKLDSLEAHTSQFESTMKAIDADQLAAFRTRIRERLAALGEPYGLAAAELFARLSDL
jgi:LmbE family N-acetylglucosaminyl deacetylase